MAQQATQLRSLSELAQTRAQQQGQQAAGQAGIQLEQAARGARPTGVAQVQQAGATIQQAQQQGFVQAQQAGAQQSLQLRDQARQLEAAQQQATLQERELGLQTQQRKLQERIYGMDRKLGNELFRKQVQFKRDQLGRMQWNEQQLSDYRRLTAQSKQELIQYEMNLRQMWEKKQSFLRIAHERLTQEYKNKFAREEFEADAEAKKSMELLIQKLERDMYQAQADAQNSAMRTQAIFSTVGSIAGGIVGGIYGGPMGAAAGASAGGALFGGIGSAIS